MIELRGFLGPKPSTFKRFWRRHTRDGLFFPSDPFFTGIVTMSQWNSYYVTDLLKGKSCRRLIVSGTVLLEVFSGQCIGYGVHHCRDSLGSQRNVPFPAWEDDNLILFMAYLATSLSICKETIACERLRCKIAFSKATISWRFMCRDLSFCDQIASRSESASRHCSPSLRWRVGPEGDDRLLSVEIKNCLPDVELRPRS